MSSPPPNTSSPSTIRINLNTSNHASRVSSASLASLASVSSLSTVKSIDYDAHQLRILDQLLLPAKKVWLFIRNTEDAYQAIKNMQVRGAPAIAIVGMLGLAIELNNMETEGLMTPDLVHRIEERLDYLILSRPTAVNLRNECQNAKKLIKECLEAELDTQETINRYIDFAETLLVDDVCSNVSLSE